jgi:DNA-directed RNA polymerase specialized sigma24 family protein
MDLESLVRAAAGGDLDAFAELTRRFQHMAFGYALSFVRDLGQAEDVVQEAFIAAWHALPTLADPAAFAGWLRGIVRHRAHRVLRRQKLLRFFAQPFYVAEPYTKRPGVTVGLAESLRVCREILDGVHDAVPTKAFYFTGGLGAVMEQAATP